MSTLSLAFNTYWNRSSRTYASRHLNTTRHSLCILLRMLYSRFLPTYGANPLQSTYQRLNSSFFVDHVRLLSQLLRILLFNEVFAIHRLKRFDPQIWLPSLTLFWGIASICQGLVTNKAGLFGIRFCEWRIGQETGLLTLISQCWASPKLGYSLE